MDLREFGMISLAVIVGVVGAGLAMQFLADTNLPFLSDAAKTARRGFDS